MAPPTSEEALTGTAHPSSGAACSASDRSLNDTDSSDDLCSCGGLPHWADVARELEARDAGSAE